MFGKKHKSTKSTKITRSSGVSIFEPLETRAMFSASPLTTVHTAATSATAPTLTINGTSAGDEIKVFQSGNIVTIYGNGYTNNYAGPFSAINIHGNAGNDTIGVDKSVSTHVNVYGDSGNDVLVAGASNDSIYAGTGSTNLIALGGKNNKLFCGTGYDNVWMTGTNTYTKSTGKFAVHSIGSFINTSNVSVNFTPVLSLTAMIMGTDHDGTTFKEPATDTQTKDTGGWASVNGDNGSEMAFPLFGPKGPQLDDINQGEAGTCYFLSSLGEVAKRDAQQIRNIITPLGDGTYAEQFVNTSTHKIGFVRVDGYLPTSAVNPSGLEYDKLGPTSNGSDTWAPLMEKGWAYFRAYEHGKAASYGFAEGGWGWEGLTALGATNVHNVDADPTLYNSWKNGTDQLKWIAGELAQGKAVEAGFSKEVAGQLCSGHEYSVVSVGTVNGHYGIWVRNPWGVDTEQQTMASAGHNDGKNDGYVFIYADTFMGDCMDLASAKV